MKKIIFLAAVISVLASCITPPPKKKEKADREIGIELKKLIEECIEIVPNAADNAIAMRRLQDTIRARMEKKIGDTLDLIHNYPLRINDYVKFDPIFLGSNIKSKKSYKGKYIVTFEKSNSKNMVIEFGYSPEFEIKTVMEPDSLEKLKDDGKYKLQGIFKGFIYPVNVYRRGSHLYISLGTMFLDDGIVKPFIEED